MTADPSAERLADLEELRDRLKGWLEQPAADRAQLALRLTSVLEQIEALKKAAPQAKGTVLDEIAEKRAAKSPGGPARRRV